MRPGDVIAIALGPDRQDQQNVRKLRGLDQARWERLVNLIYENGNQTALEEICEILDLDEERQQAEALAARGNMTAIVRSLHDPASQLMDMLMEALSQGKLCVVDVSQLRGAQAMILSGLILRRIFDRNQQEFTEANSRKIPTIAVIEEAQSVLVEGSVSAEPYIAWVKEGRKYDLGAVLVTQQPGSIPVEILSQGDNWFIFHLLAAADLYSLSKANAHFRILDLLSALLNEPIAGQGVFWSSVGGKPYPVSLRALSFEQLYSARDAQYQKAAAHTYSAALRAQFSGGATGFRPDGCHFSCTGNCNDCASSYHSLDVTEAMRRRVTVMEISWPEIAARAKTALESAGEIRSQLEGTGMAWGSLQKFIKDRAVPTNLDDGWQVAYNTVPKVYERSIWCADSGVAHVQKRRKNMGEEGAQAMSIALNGICPYFTMFPLGFPRRVLKRYASQDETVLDPFAGRGTTLYAARLQGMRAYGIDSNPVAVAISEAKLANTTPRRIVAAAQRILGDSKVPKHVPVGDFWELAFDATVLVTLCRLREGLLSDCRSDTRKALRATILGALHGPVGKTVQSHFRINVQELTPQNPGYAVSFWSSRGLFDHHWRTLSK